MVQALLVEMQIQEGKRLIDQLLQEGVAIPVAAWVKESDCGYWYLYLATPLVSDKVGTTPAYRRVKAVIRELQKDAFEIDLDEIKVIGPHERIAKDMVARRHPGWTRRPTWLRGRFEELGVEEALIYPPIGAPRKVAAVKKE